MQKFDQYKQLKLSFRFTYRGYELANILAGDILYEIYEKRSNSFNFSVLKDFVFKIPDLSVYRNVFLQKKVLFTSLGYGVDHENLLLSIKDQVSDSILVKHEYALLRRRKWKNILVSFIQCFLIWHPNALSNRQRLYFFSRLVYYKNFIDELESLENKVGIKRYVAYLSATAPDAIFCQFFKKRFVPTYCIQHGILRSEYEFRDFIPLDAINIENFQADFMLGWGEYMREAMIKSGYIPERCKIVGNPRYSDSHITIDVARLSTEKCIVSLARDTYLNENLELLMIAGELQRNGTNVILKFHPRSDLSKYEECLKLYDLKYMDLKTTLSESITNYNPDFVIVYNSTVYYEYYLSNVPVFRFGLNECDIPLGLDEDRFVSYSDLLVKIDMIRAMRQDVYLDKLKNSIGKVIAYGVNDYKQILSND